MTTHTTRTLAQEIIGDDSKGATRELRKFLRADAVAKGGKVGVDTPGKGGRYTIDLNKRELTAMTKRFKAWQVQQEEEAAKRAEARNTAKATESPIAVEADTEDEGDTSLDTVEGPTDEEIAEMLTD